VNFAYLTDSEKLYFAHQPKDENSPTSAIVRLIQGVYAHDPKNALSIIRNRIFSTAQATEMCHGMVKVAAKRLTDSVSLLAADEVLSGFSSAVKIDVSESVNALLEELPFEADIRNTLDEIVRRENPSSETEWMKAARKLLRAEDDLPVAALLISHDGKILSAAINSNSQNRTLHAEVNLIQSFYRTHQRKIPPQSKIITTLKPCKMCAAMIWTWAENIESMQVIFGEMDEGSHARETVLNPGTFERKRASQSQTQLTCLIEQQI
jgi:tRNA(Arg) A34 adenosine deaminase TadA